MKIAFHQRGWQDYGYWKANDAKMLARVDALITGAMRSTYRGIGKPEPLGENMSGWWSRRLDSEHRLVYRVAGKGEDQVLEILQCRFHYRR